MSTDSQSPSPDFIGKLNYSATLPLMWRRIAEPPNVEETAAFNAGNESLLQALAVIDDRPVASGDEKTPLAAELQRIDIMLGLLLTQVNKLVAAQAGAPPGRDLRMALNGIEWVEADGPPPDSRLVMEIYLHPALQLPLRVFGRVCAHRHGGEAVPAGDNVSVQATFESLTPAVEEELQRFIFRQHRRHIAARSGLRPETASDDSSSLKEQR